MPKVKSKKQLKNEALFADPEALATAMEAVASNLAVPLVFMPPTTHRNAQRLLSIGARKLRAMNRPESAEISSLRAKLEEAGERAKRAEREQEEIGCSWVKSNDKFNATITELRAQLAETQKEIALQRRETNDPEEKKVLALLHARPREFAEILAEFGRGANSEALRGMLKSLQDRGWVTLDPPRGNSKAAKYRLTSAPAEASMSDLEEAYAIGVLEGRKKAEKAIREEAGALLDACLKAREALAREQGVKAISEEQLANNRLINLGINWP